MHTDETGHEMRVGSMFTGYGGLDAAVVVHYGASVAWHCEFDKHPSMLLEQHYPNIPNLGDVRGIDWSQVEPVDLLTGGFPCQDVSHAGLRAGIQQGNRSGLWFEMVRAIDALKPWKVIIENVAGLRSTKAHSSVEPCQGCVGDGSASGMRALGVVLADLAEMGYDAKWGSVRASEAGAPHRRERVFIIATDTSRERFHRGGTTGSQRGAEPSDSSLTSEELILFPTPTARDHKGRANKPGRLRQGRPRTPGDNTLPDAVEELKLLPTPTAQAAKHGSTPDVHANGYGYNLWDIPSLLPTPVASVSEPAPWKPGVQWWLQSRASRNLEAIMIGNTPLLPTPTSRDWKGRNQRNDASCLPGAIEQRFGTYAEAVLRWEHITGRPAPEPTEPGRNDKPRLSPVFVEWMMGLPTGWVTDIGVPRTGQLKILGNGVVPQQALLALELLDPT